MTVPQGRNQKKTRRKSKMRTYYPAVWGSRLEDVASEDFPFRGGDKLGQMLLNRPTLEGMLSRDPMGFLDRKSFLDPAGTTDPDEADYEDFYEDMFDDMEDFE